MSKRQRTSPSRGMRDGLPGAKRGPAAPLFMAREIVAALADAVVVTGGDRRIVTANRAAAELFGRPLEDMPGTAIDDLVAVAERERVAEWSNARGGARTSATRRRWCAATAPSGTWPFPPPPSWWK